MEDNLFTISGVDDPFDTEKYISALESILFAAGDAVKKKDLMRIMDVTASDLEDIIGSYEEELKNRNRGIRLLLLENRIQLGTKESNTPYLKELLGVNERQSLSKGALECLSIVAFKQPVTRVEVDEIRGVNSDYVIQKLQEKGLIKVIGRKEAPGRPKLYGTTDEFLIQFGFSSLNEMKEENPIPERIIEKDEKKKAMEIEDIELFEEE
ncbi:SMC-Scp complex subunit ScpB [Proteiniclasticum sp. C24MP]|uniref:SMC-Scp complex subunit ScpB n=1 Tax=Proteiniclasticum sp. C24MP TaxID=3374101 RepID=UPI0037549E5A